MTDEQSRLREALKLVAVLLKESEVSFALAGGYALWARGAPEPHHDVDFVVPEQDRERVAELESEGSLDVSADSALGIVQRVLDVTGDDRLGVLLLSEIRIRALRDPQLARAYLAWDDELHRSVTQIVADIEHAQGLRLRVPAAEAARFLITIWDSSTVRGTMAGLDYDELCRRTNEDIARAATLVIDLS